jgi:hypothetical protein
MAEDDIVALADLAPLASEPLLDVRAHALDAVVRIAGTVRERAKRLVAHRLPDLRRRKEASRQTRL